jgi:hypothetical protein
VLEIFCLSSGIIRNQERDLNPSSGAAALASGVAGCKFTRIPTTDLHFSLDRLKRDVQSEKALIRPSSLK